MAAQLPQIIPAPLLFPTSGPIFDAIGYFPNQAAANAGVLPSLLGIAGGPGNIPVLNDFKPVMPSLVTQIFGGGPPGIGSTFRPFPFGSGVVNGGGGVLPTNGAPPGSVVSGGLPTAFGTNPKGNVNGTFDPTTGTFTATA